MTAGELKTLKQAQGQTIKGGNLAELNRINKIQFKERETPKDTRASKRARARKSAFCEKMLSALSVTIINLF